MTCLKRPFKLELVIIFMDSIVVILMTQRCIESPDRFFEISGKTYISN